MGFTPAITTLVVEEADEPRRAFAAVVERPVAAASADLGPDRGISGLPRLMIGLAMEIISGMSFSTN
jgi:hypothetical protein